MGSRCDVSAFTAREAVRISASVARNSATLLLQAEGCFFYPLILALSLLHKSPTRTQAASIFGSLSHTWLDTHTHMRARARAHIHTITHTRTRAHTHTQNYTHHTHNYTHTHTQLHTTHTHTHTQLHIHTRTHTHTHTHTQSYTHNYTHTHTQLHTHHTHTITHKPHTHTRRDSFERLISLSQRPLPTQQATNTKEEHPCPQQDSNPQSQDSA